jgi:hypothetical protein
LIFYLFSLRYMVADHGYDDKGLYGYSKKLRIDLVFTIKPIKYMLGISRHGLGDKDACFEL